MNRNVIAILALCMGAFSIAFILGHDSGGHTVRLSPHFVVESADDYASADETSAFIALDSEDN